MFLLKKEGSYLQISPIERSLLGLCLSLLGKYSTALREATIAVELSDEYTQADTLLFLGTIYNISGHPQESNQVMKYLNMRYPYMNWNHDSSSIKIENIETVPPCIEYATLSSRSHSFHQLIQSIGIEQFDDEFFNTETLTETIFEQVIEFLNVQIDTDIVILEETFVKIHAHWKDNEQQKRKRMRSSIIIGYCKFHQKEFKIAFDIFSDSINSINESGILKENILSINLLRAQSLMKLTKFSLHEIDEQLLDIICWSEKVDPRKDYENGRLEYYFQIVGLLYLERSIPKRSPTSLVKISKNDLYEFIRKFIIVSTIKYPDDSTLLDIFNLILTSFFLYGGISIKIFWFFKTIKEYFAIEQSLYLGVQENSFGLSKLGHQLNDTLKTFLEFFCNLRDICTEKEKKNLIGDYYCLPNVDLKIKKDNKFELNPTQEFVSENFTMDNELDELVELWLKSYKDYHGSIPLEIERITSYLGFDYNFT